MNRQSLCIPEFVCLIILKVFIHIVTHCIIFFFFFFIFFFLFLQDLFFHLFFIIVNLFRILFVILITAFFAEFKLIRRAFLFSCLRIESLKLLKLASFLIYGDLFFLFQRLKILLNNWFRFLFINNIFVCIILVYKFFSW